MLKSDLRPLLENTIFEDYRKSLEIEEHYQKQVDQMKKIGLGNSVGYVSLVEEKVTISYVAANLYRLLQIVKGLNDDILEQISPQEMRIKSKLENWRKHDIKRARKMRKDIGDGGVILMKRSINNSIRKINLYISNLQKLIKEL
tara:strand:+ start:1686 stop:2117 length:432 start_codon:yes stop_codon:yes gene_type:complete